MIVGSNPAEVKSHRVAHPASAHAVHSGIISQFFALIRRYRSSMKSEFKLTRLAGLNLTARPSAIIGSLALWIVLSGIALALIKLSVGEAIFGGLIATLLHWTSETLHQFGHAQAARQAGYLMIGIRYWGVLSTSVYPDDEPALPASIHIRRALGGPSVSIVVGILIGLLALALRDSAGLLKWLALFAALENLLVFGLGAFLPLGFTDGSTLLRYWSKH